jgi:hypothetical protein
MELFTSLPGSIRQCGGLALIARSRGNAEAFTERNDIHAEEVEPHGLEIHHEKLFAIRNHQFVLSMTAMAQKPAI